MKNPTAGVRAEGKTGRPQYVKGERRVSECNSEEELILLLDDQTTVEKDLNEWSEKESLQSELAGYQC